MIFLLYRAYVGTLYVLTHYISQHSLLTPSLQMKDRSGLFYRVCQVNSPNSRLSEILPVMPCFQIISCGAGGNTTKELMDGGGACFWCQDFLNL